MRGARLGARHAADSHALLTFLDLDFGDSGLLQEFDQLFYFSNVHASRTSWLSRIADDGWQPARRGRSQTVPGRQCNRLRYPKNTNGCGNFPEREYLSNAPQ